MGQQGHWQRERTKNSSLCVFIEYEYCQVFPVYRFNGIQSCVSTISSTGQLILLSLCLHYNHHIQCTIHIVLLLAIPCSWLCLTFSLLFFLSSLHHAGLTHKLSKLGWLVEENKQKCKAGLESCQADNAQVSSTVMQWCCGLDTLFTEVY